MFTRGQACIRYFEWATNTERSVIDKCVYLYYILQWLLYYIPKMILSNCCQVGIIFQTFFNNNFRMELEVYGAHII